MRIRVKKKRKAKRKGQLEHLESRMPLHAEAITSGYVFLDADNSNSRDGTELGVPGVVINLSGSDTDGANVELSTFTDNNGFYEFGELNPGTYQISKRQSSSMRDGQESTSVSGATASNDLIDNVVLADDDVATDNNFGELGLEPRFINILWLFSSTPPASQMLRETVALAEEIDGDDALAETIRNGGGDVPDLNSTPVANDDSFAVDSGSTLTVSAADGVLANDSDADNDTLTATVVAQPSNGSLTLNIDGSFTYEPNANFSGADTFTYTASDGSLASGIATVTVIVEAVDDPDPPNTPFGPVTAGNFRDEGLAGVRTDLLPGAPPMNADHVTTAVDYSEYSNPPTYGPHHAFQLDSQGNAVTPRATGVYETEQPDEDMVHGLEHGHVWISYNRTLISSDDLNALRQFVIDGGTNTGVIMTPRAANDDAIAVASWGRLLTLDSLDKAQIRNFVELNRGKSDGEGFIPSGQKSDDPASENLSDGLPHTPPVVIENTAPSAGNDSYQTDQGVVLNVSVGQGVLTNDSDPENDSLTAAVVSNPTDGTLTLNQDGSFTYAPNANFTGTDAFTYRANDGELNSSNATVSITVNATNSAPVASDDNYSVDEDQTLTVNVSNGVLANDSDADGDNLTATIAEDVSNGQLTLNADGSFSYTPSADFSGTDTFGYAVSDGSLSANGSVVITVNPADNTQSFSLTAVASQDTTLVESPTGAAGNGAGNAFFVGTTNRNANALRRGLVAFDPIDVGVPQGATVTNVELTMNMSRTNFGNSDVSLHRVSTAWGEGAAAGGGFGAAAATNDATWIHSAFPSSNWNTPGGDFVAAPSATTSVGGNGPYVWSSPQMIADVQSWIDNPSDNFGWIVLGDETTPSAKKFDSREASNPANQPQLLIEYDA